MTLKLSNTDNSHAFDLSPRFIIAADGAHSQIREAIGVRLTGQEALQTLMNVHFTCPGLRQLLQPRSAMLYFVFNEVMIVYMSNMLVLAVVYAYMCVVRYCWTYMPRS